MVGGSSELCVRTYSAHLNLQGGVFLHVCIVWFANSSGMQHGAQFVGALSNCTKHGCIGTSGDILARCMLSYALVLTAGLFLFLPATVSAVP